MANYFDESSDDEDVMELATTDAVPRPRLFHPRTNHFVKWRNGQFLRRFRLSKRTVRFVLGLIIERISSRANRYSIQPL